jgi:ribosomal protein S8
MSMTDPIADMFTRIRNAQAMGKAVVSMPASKAKAAIADLLKSEGYILDVQLAKEGAKANLEIRLKYFEGRPAIERIAASRMEQLVVTNTIPLSEAAQQVPRIKVLSIAGLLGAAIESIHIETSVSSLFN